MTPSILTTSNIMFAIGIISLLFTIYKSYNQPQQDLKEKQALDSLATDKDKLLAEKDLGTKATILAQKELETKALVLAEQVKNKDAENERRFNDMGVRMDTAMTTAQNHIHTVDVKVDALITNINLMSNEITRLATIIDERIPKKM